MTVGTRVARWFVFKPKFPNGFILEGLGMENVFYDHLKYFMAIWCYLLQFGIVLWSFGIFFPFWYVWTKKNLATLVGTVGFYESVTLKNWFE
jgi:hypothetical protein